MRCVVQGQLALFMYRGMRRVRRMLPILIEAFPRIWIRFDAAQCPDFPMLEVTPIGPQDRIVILLSKSKRQKR